MNPSVSIPWPPSHLRNFRKKTRYRFAVLNWGTRGDIQPFAGLGAELVRRGHQVVFAAREPFRKLIEEHGMECYAMREDGTEDLMKALAACRSTSQMIQISSSYSRRIVRQQLREFWDASRDADAVLSKVITTSAAVHIAEGRGLPIFLVHIDLGFIPTGAYCFAGGRIQDRGRLLNRLMSRFLLASLGLTVSDRINAWRREHRMPVDWLAKRNRSAHLLRFPAFAVWSPHYLQRPPDWPEWIVQTGWWRMPRKTPVAERVRAFVEAGPPPVYIGFGSWGAHDRTAMTDLILETLRVTGNRGIVLRKTVDERTEFPENVLVADELPHDWLFPLLKAAVHHGGGTMGTAAAAGIPSIIIPAFSAQELWGHLIMEKGIGGLLDPRSLSVDSLAAKLLEVTRPEVRERARAMGALVRTDGGEKQAADEIERRLAEAAEGASVPTVAKPAKGRPVFSAGESVARWKPPAPLEWKKIPRREPIPEDMEEARED